MFTTRRTPLTTRRIVIACAVPLALLAIPAGAIGGESGSNPCVSCDRYIADVAEVLVAARAQQRQRAMTDGDALLAAPLTAGAADLCRDHFAHSATTLSDSCVRHFSAHGADGVDLLLSSASASLCDERLGATCEMAQSALQTESSQEQQEQDAKNDGDNDNDEEEDEGDDDDDDDDGDDDDDNGDDDEDKDGEGDHDRVTPVFLGADSDAPAPTAADAKKKKEKEKADAAAAAAAKAKLAKAEAAKARALAAKKRAEAARIRAEAARKKAEAAARAKKLAVKAAITNAMTNAEKEAAQRRLAHIREMATAKAGETARMRRERQARHAAALAEHRRLMRELPSQAVQKVTYDYGKPYTPPKYSPFEDAARIAKAKSLYAMMTNDMKFSAMMDDHDADNAVQNFDKMLDWDAADKLGDGDGGKLGAAGLSSGMVDDPSSDRSADLTALMPYIAGGLLHVDGA